jgi:hypothetical protein
MIRGVVLILLSIAVAAACGFGACRGLHLEPHAKEMVLACIVALMASGFGMTLVMLADESSQTAVAQTGLMATAAHLLACLVFAGAVLLTRIASPVPLLLWMLPVYWATLIVLAVEIVRGIKRSHPVAKIETK